MDDSDQWNGSAMEVFNDPDSDLMDELKINDNSHVTSPHDNDGEEVKNFHGTEVYSTLTNSFMKRIDNNKFDISHISDENGGTFHLHMDSNKFHRPENWQK